MVESNIVKELSDDFNQASDGSDTSPSKPPTTYSPTRTEDSSNISMDEPLALKQTLGLHHGIAMIVGGIIGSGIFVSPKGVLQEIGSVGGSLVIWVLCGVVSFVGALCYAELGTSILKSGADYAYIREAYGALPGFLFIWVALVIIYPAANAITSLTFSNYILQPLFLDCEPPESAVKLIAAASIIVLTVINCYNVSWAARLQNIFTVMKLLALFIIIIIGFVRIFYGQTEYLENMFEDTSNSPGSYALAFYSGLFSYSGWNYLNYVTEEIKNPYKNLPRAIWISIPMVTIVYTFTNVAYFTVLSPSALLDSNAVAVSFGGRVLGVMWWIMPLFVAASTFGSLNCALFASSRLAFVGAREGLLPRSIALININFFTPITALIAGALLSLAMLVSSDLYVLINYASFTESLIYGVSVSGLLYLRWKKPEMTRPIKVNLILPIIFLIMVAFLVLVPLFYNATECLVGLAMIISGIPVYLVFVSWTSKPKCFNRWIDNFTMFVQKLFISTYQEDPKFD